MFVLFVPPRHQDQGVDRGGGHIGAALAAHVGNVRDGTSFHQQGLGLGGVDKSHRQADHQGRPDPPLAHEVDQAQKGRGGIAHHVDAAIDTIGGHIHGGLGPRDAVAQGGFGHLLIGHKAGHRPTETVQVALADAHAGHVGVGNDGASVADGGHTGADGLRMQPDHALPLEIGTGMDDPPHHPPFIRPEAMIAGLTVDNAKTLGLDLLWFHALSLSFIADQSLR
ncbi:hypothetical protein DESC_870103 [Desulfosarcina cetonica]|nr:hypothetical protein DESC_870103 [Desulfosarcina cetonica]